MLPKKNRADKKVVERIFKEGRVINAPNLALRFVASRGPARISVIVPKSTAKKAVERNRLRRRGYSVLEKYIKQLPLGLAGVLIFKKYQEDFSIIEDEIKNIFNKIN